MQNHNQYTFRVRREATKSDVKKAVQLMFDVKVTAVQVVNEPGKTQPLRQTIGRTQDWKKAYVSLAAGPDDRLRSPRQGARRVRTHRNGSHQIQTKIPGAARGDQDRSRSHLHKGGPHARSPRTEQDRRAQPLWPHHHAPPRRRLAPEVPPHRFQARQGRHPGVVERLEYDPNRTAHIALVLYTDGERRYILATKGMIPGDEIRSGADAPSSPATR